MNDLITSRATCILLFCVAWTMAATGQTVTTLATLDATGGSEPEASLVQGSDGKLYGTTAYGGTHCGGNQPCGTVFNIDSVGTLTTLHDFSFIGSPGGDSSTADLVLGIDGNYYGTTALGGNTTNCPDSVYGCGTVFRISPDGMLTVLYSFCARVSCPDGLGPAGLLQGNDGNFYGITSSGPTTAATSLCGSFGCGTVFKITPSGELTTLYRFCSQTTCADGLHPQAAMVQGMDGSFYGTTQSGGGHIVGGAGTVFKITPSGELTTLYRFCSQAKCADGLDPYGLTMGADGNFYGTTFWNTIFKVTPAGKFTKLYTLGSMPNDGTTPSGTLVQATDGNLYGTTFTGGSVSTCTSGCGTIFKVTPSGAATTVYNFCSQTDCADGADPFGGLVQDTNGKIYGTTFSGGNGSKLCVLGAGCGTIFSLDLGLGAFVTFVHNSGKVGQTAQILGQGFTGTSGVSFNGTAATFTIESDTLLKATIPAGAITGAVTVATPSGALASNQIFLVRPQIFSLSVTSGAVGSSVVINGESLTGATEVVFSCGKAASFTVDSDTQITATVPAGAMTGAISVVTPGGNTGSGTFTVTP